MPHTDPVKRREYNRKWKQAHPDYDAQKAREYRKRHPLRTKSSGQKYRQKHRHDAKVRTKLWRDRHPDYAKQYREKNREIIKIKAKTYRRQHLSEDAKRSREYRLRHPDKIKKLNQKYYDKNRSVLNQKNRQRYLELKQLVFSRYSNGQIKCRNCDESGLDFLTLDHIAGRRAHGHSTSFSAAKLWYHLKKNDYPEGYQVLCWNCNVLKYRKTALPTINSQKALWARNARKKKKIDALNHYSKGRICCACCGFDNFDALGLDHIAGRRAHGHSKTLTSVRLYNDLKKNNYPRGFQILCYNCNGAKSDNGLCPHQIVN